MFKTERSLRGMMIYALTDTLTSSPIQSDWVDIIKKIIALVVGVRPYSISMQDQLVELWNAIRKDADLTDVIMGSTTRLIWNLHFYSTQDSTDPYANVIGTKTQYDKLIASLAAAMAYHGYDNRLSAIDDDYVKHLAGYRENEPDYATPHQRKNSLAVTDLVDLYKANSWFVFLLVIYVIGPDSILGDMSQEMPEQPPKDEKK